MRQKIQNRNNFRSNFEETAPLDEELTDSNVCQLCGRDPEEVIRSLGAKTRRRRVFAGLYTVMKHTELGNIFHKVCRQCFLVCIKGNAFRPALPPGAARRKRFKHPPDVKVKKNRRSFLQKRS